MGEVIGIDLGTTNSAIAYIKNGEPVIIENPKSTNKRTTMSIVGSNNEIGNRIIIGEGAKENKITSPSDIVCEVKRKMGEDEKVRLGSKEYLPEEISAFILKELKGVAERYLGKKVTDAVITVPARFNDNQRRATKAAGDIAGLNILRIINEPTAAALAYGIRNLKLNERVLVYDLGGGTFDVSILEMFEGVVEVRTSEGDNRLGGSDFDTAIMEFLLNEIKEKYEVDLSNDPMARYRVKEAAERAKINLTIFDTEDIDIPRLGIDRRGLPFSFRYSLTRDKFDSIVKHLIIKTEEVIDEALEIGNLSDEDIDTVLLIGGSTKMPIVSKMLRNRFGNKVRKNINPDLAVALGAAVQAGIISGEIEGEEGTVITDICPYTIGTSIVEETNEDIFDPIIKKDSMIPCTVKKVYYTVENNQDTVIIDIYQGENRFIKDNVKIGEFELKDIPPSLAGKEGVEVAVSYDVDGIIKVDALILSNRRKASVVIDTKSMSNREIKKSKKRIEEVWEKSHLKRS